MTKEIYEYSLEELQRLPVSDGFLERVSYNEIIIVPTDEIHDSGFQCMEYVLISNTTGRPLVTGVVGGYSDVLHLGLSARSGVRVNIDCLPASKCVRMIFYEEMVTPGFIGSDFYIMTAKEWSEENEQV